MATSVDVASRDTAATLPSGSWMLPVARAVAAAIIALIITFSSDHSALLGLATFGSYALVEGIILLVLGSRGLPARVVGSFRIQAAVGILSGVLALIAIIALSEARLIAYLGLVVGWALITGALELMSGIRARGRSVSARDWMTIGGMTLILALVVLLVRPDYQHAFGGDNKVPPGVLTASIMAVGLFGAYAAIVAVFQFIAGLSLKWAPGTSAASAARVTKGD